MLAADHERIVLSCIADGAKEFQSLNARFQETKRLRNREPPNAQGSSDASFTFGRSLVIGSFGTVDEVLEETTNEVYARKNIRLPSDRSAANLRITEVQDEVKAMQQLHHLHIANLAFWLKLPEMCSIFMQPVADFDLRCYLEECIRRGYPQEELGKILPWFGCLLEALAFAHRRRIIHRDIKPSNILIKDHHVYLADFGSARAFTSLETSKTSIYYKCGTPVYLVPEVSRGRQADVFSLGCVFSEMLSVYSRRSLKAFQRYRENTGDEYSPFAFRGNPHKVYSWLQELNQNQDTKRDYMVWQCKGMLRAEPEGPDGRFTAEQALAFLRNPGLESFRCQHH